MSQQIILQEIILQQIISWQVTLIEISQEGLMMIR